MEIRVDEWLSSELGREAFRVEGGCAIGSSEAAEVARHAAGRKTAFYFAKIETTGIEAMNRLAAIGFTVVDAAITFVAQPSAVVALPAGGVTVAALVPSDAAAVQDIAGSCFRFSRFHLDPRIPDPVAHAIKRHWVGSYINRRRGDRVFVARRENGPVGFLAAMTAEVDGRKTAVIDLVGVKSSEQRSGVGRALVTRFAEHYAGSVEYLKVGTQAANVPSMRLYERLGFRTAGSSYVLHMHRGVD